MSEGDDDIIRLFDHAVKTERRKKARRKGDRRKRQRRKADKLLVVDPLQKRLTTMVLIICAGVVGIIIPSPLSRFFEPLLPKYTSLVQGTMVSLPATPSPKHISVIPKFKVWASQMFERWAYNKLESNMQTIHRRLQIYLADDNTIDYLEGGG